MKEFREFLNTSEYYVSTGNYFLGNFNVDYNHLKKIHNHFLETDENLINNYVRVIYLSWDNYPLYYKQEYEFLNYSLCRMRELKIFNFEFILLCKDNLKKGYNRYLSFLIKSNKKPRREAQKFISKSNIREFIFKRDNYTCLCCGSKEKLTIDHIVAVNKEGENKISNLQTLCKSCNSRKSDKYKDYR